MNLLFLTILCIFVQLNTTYKSKKLDELNVDSINVAITFTKARNNQNLISKMQLCVHSLLKYATIDINFYIIGDDESQKIASLIFSKARNIKIEYKVSSRIFYYLKLFYY